MTVGDRIREIRVSLEISQTELAKRAGYSDKTRISKIENSGNEISMKQVKRIAKALNVDSAFLMGWRQPEDTERAKALREYYKSFAIEEYTKEEQELIRMFRRVDDSTKIAAYNVLKGGITNSKSSKVANDK